MNNRLIIGIIGKKYHGKDTIADIIVSKYDYRKIHFANPLKEGCRHIFGLTEKQLYGNEKDVVDKYWRITPRKLLQFVGTDLFRNQLGKVIPYMKNSVWVQRLEKTFIDNPDTNYVVADIRFQNEVDMLKKHGAFIIKLHRPNIKNDDEHFSETGIDDIKGFDLLILNDTTINELYNKINNIMYYLKNTENTSYWFK